MMKPNLKPGRVLRHLILVSLSAGVLAACGDNLFEEGDPKLNSFEASATQVAEGDTVVFTARASGPRTIDKIRIQVTGAFVKDTTYVVAEPSTDVVAELLLPIPTGTGPLSGAEVVAHAIDVGSAASDARAITLTIADETAPEVSAASSPSEVAAGEEITIAVFASDNRAVATVGVVAVGYYDDGTDETLTHTFAEPAEEVEHEFTLTAPPMDMGGLDLIPFAIDVSGNRTDGISAGIGIEDRKGPTFVSLETDPDSMIPLLDTVKVQVITELTDPAGIRQVTFIGLSYRGVPSEGTDFVVERFAQKVIEFPRPTEGGDLPTSYTLNPYLFSDDITTTELVEIFVVAEDALGNVSDTSKIVVVGGPDVSITDPPDDFAVQLGRSISVAMDVYDRSGIDSVKLVVTTATSVETFDMTIPTPSNERFTLDQVVTLPSTVQVVRLQAFAWNGEEVGGRSAPVFVDVVEEAVGDVTPPTVSVTAERFVPTDAGNRMEMLDEIEVTVSALDGNAGLTRLGLTILTEFNGQVDTLRRDMAFPATNERRNLVFRVPMDELLTELGVADVAAFEASLPADIDLRFHGFGVDADGNLACAVAVGQQLACEAIDATTPPYYTAAGVLGLRMEIEVVRGVTVLLNDRTAGIADLAVDTIEDRLFLSNRTQNLIEFMELDADYRNSFFFGTPVQVGAEPVGIFLGERVVSDSEAGFGITLPAGSRARTLFVANSGGTNISLVHMDPTPANVEEVDVVRLQTTNSVLWQITEEFDEFGNVRFLGEWYDFSDRPQYLAQDSLLRIVYSTIPTAYAPMATVRYVNADPDPTATVDEPEVRFLLSGDMVQPTENTLALANIDSLIVWGVSGGDDLIQVFSHVPGYPGDPATVIESPPSTQVSDAVAYIEAEITAAMAGRPNADQAPNFFPFLRVGAWDFNKVQWSDQTFVTASGDRGKIALGEGEAVPTGRIMIWHADSVYTLSDAIQIEDLQGNASDEVRGVGLNQNGTLGVARGRETTYFFDPNLRMTGGYVHQSAGGAGAALHPDHDALTDGGHHDPGSGGVAFAGTADNSIEVVNTFHFNLVNTLVIRDDIVGPLIAGPPLATDNGGLAGQCVALTASPADQDCVVAKLYAITTAGGVVIVNVRLRDLEPVTP
ncbi:MAG: hypothetical protein ABR602_05340 [Gemmatimonadales bacterium]